MAPSKKNTKGRENDKLVGKNRYSDRWCCDCHGTPHSRKNFNVQELIYQLLNVKKHNQARRRKWPSSQKRKMPRERREPRRSSRTCPYEGGSVSRANSECEAASIENLTETTDAASSSATQSSTNGDVNNSFVKAIRPDSADGARALLNKRSFVQIINNYIKAGIEEGKRQAKMYIRKALCFGVKSGYLIPADSKGQVLKVSPTLVDSRKSDTESRKRRRQARKGEENVERSIERSIERKNSSSWHIKTSRDENTTLAPRRKTEKPKRKVSRRNSNRAKSKDSVENSTQDDGERPKRGRKRKIRVGKVQKKRTQRKRPSKESTRRSRTSSKSPSNHDVKTDRDLDDRNWSDNEEMCHNRCKAKDDHSESIECPMSKHRLLATNQEESRDDEMEEARRENNEEIKDSVEERNEA